MLTFIDFFAGLQFALRTGSKGAAAGGKAAEAVQGRISAGDGVGGAYMSLPDYAKWELDRLGKDEE